MRGLRLATLTASVAAAAASAGATAGLAAGTNAAAYRAQVNAICRSYTPKFTQIEDDMARARRAGDANRSAFDLGLALELTLKQGLRIEKTPVPADARPRMAAPLRLLHAVDLRLQSTLAAIARGDGTAYLAEAAKLVKVAAPLNRTFDGVGLRDCGSNQL